MWWEGRGPELLDSRLGVAPSTLWSANRRQVLGWSKSHRVQRATNLNNSANDAVALHYHNTDILLDFVLATLLPAMTHGPGAQVLEPVTKYYRDQVTKGGGGTGC